MAKVLRQIDDEAIERPFDKGQFLRLLRYMKPYKGRVAIARAVLVDPSILIMDDSTSAVDMETEYLIQQELKEVLKNRTTFIIAHRITSVKNADLILVLDGGRIAERGTHQQLLEKKGIYYRMVQDQYRDFDQFARRKAGEA